MKLKIKDLHPNPYKKEIDGGKLHQDQIDSIKANLDKLGLMDAIPVVKINGKWCIVSHHHRVGALKQQYGEDYEVNVVEHKYDDETMLRGMVTENLTQRSGDFRQTKENLSLIKKQLNEHPEWLGNLYIYRTPTFTGKSHGKEVEMKKTQQSSKGIGYGQIYRWLHNIDSKEKEEYYKEHDKAKNQMIAYQTIAQTIQIEEKLDEELKEQVDKKHDKPVEEREEGLNQTQALYLSQFEDKQEQKDLAKALKNSREGRVREQGKLLTIYKQASDDVKEKIRNGILDLADVEIAVYEESVDEGDIGLSEEELDEIKENLEETRKDFENRMENPETKENLRLKHNWEAHLAIQPYIDGGWLYCPYCGRPASECLRWTCKPKNTIKEAIKKASNDYGEEK